jgi:hypothetical protein
MALGEGERWADDDRGLRYAECAECEYCRERIRNICMGAGDEILAAFQEDFDAEFLNDDGVLKVTRGRENRQASAQRLEYDLWSRTRPRLMSDSMRRRLPNVMGEIWSLGLVEQD